MRELDDVFNEGIAARESSLRGSTPALLGDQVARLVRRRRGRRYALQGVAVVAAGALLGTAGWWGLSRQAPTPALTPAPTTSSPTTPEPSATPTPATPSATPGPSTPPSASIDPSLVYLPGLPPMPPATPALIASATPGWVLAVYSPMRADSTGNANAILLISPEGQRYHVLDLPTATTLSVVRWVAGSQVADVDLACSDQAAVKCSDGDVLWEKLDLSSGALTFGSGIPGTLSDTTTLGWTPDGRRATESYDARISWWWYSMSDFQGGAGWSRASTTREPAVLSPTGSGVLVGQSDDGMTWRIHDGVTGLASYGPYGVGRPCTPISWFDASTFLAVCGDPSPSDANAPGISAAQHVGVYRIDTRGGSPVLLDQPAVGDPVPCSTATPTSTGVWAQACFVGATEDQRGQPAGVWWWGPQAGEPQPLSLSAGPGEMVSVAGASGQSVYVTTQVAIDAATPMTLARVSGGVVTELVPRDTTGDLVSGLASFAIGVP